MTAAEVKAALRKRHPATTTKNGYVRLDAWTTFEEYLSIDLLAISAYEYPARGARTAKGDFGLRRSIARYPIVGYEVKVSRADYRREILRPGKRDHARLRCHEFYFAVPKGLLTPQELAYAEPDWDPTDFYPTPCRFGYGGSEPPGRDDDLSHCRKGKRSRRVPGDPWPEFVEEVCEGCDGRGYAEPSRVQAEAPTLWVPRDVGLVEVTDGNCRVVRPSPIVHAPAPLGELGVILRYVSLRPDERHAAARRNEVQLSRDEDPPNPPDARLRRR